MSKVNLAITVDSYVANWLNEQPAKRSTLINQIIREHIAKEFRGSAKIPNPKKDFNNLTPQQQRNVVENKLRMIFPDWDEW